jgi:predicted unusual protein kinase regulating ubiquinone biosynthesis (AarF/ABC1/UbiB family)
MLHRRYRQIVFFFGKLLLTLAFWEILLPFLKMRKLAAKNREKRLRNTAAQYRLLAVRMGGVLIKVGQFLSTRMDVLPETIIQELAGLQDEVPAEEFSAIRAVAEIEFGKVLEEKFVSFEAQPMAAASLGQVHRAQVLQPVEGADLGVPLHVVVKIQRPGIEQIVATDLAALRTVGNWLHRYKPIRRRADVPALLSEFSRILLEELDYLAEGANVEIFGQNFADVSGVRVPKVFWNYTTKKALTLEDVSGIKITDYALIESAGIDRAEVADRLLATYLKQIFEDGFFHADPHPGNLFVLPVRVDHGALAVWDLTFIDFGMVGRISQKTRLALRELLVGVGTRDSARIIRSYQMLNILLPSADVKLIQQAEERLFEKFWGKNMSELRETPIEELVQLMHEFGQLMYELPFQLPHDLIFLARTVAILSGMCTGLDPNFNVWQHLVPFAQKLVSSETAGGLDYWFQELRTLAGKLAGLPRRVDVVLERIESGELVVQIPKLETRLQVMEKKLDRIRWSVWFMLVLVGGILFLLILQYFPK